MTPKEYYENHYRQDFERFWEAVPNRKDYVTGEPLFKFAGLVKGSNPDPLHDQVDALKDIPREHLVFFLSALGCTVLIDQVMYTHFKDDYSVFLRITRYPKMQVGWMNANPWMVFHQNVRLPRNLNKGEVMAGFSEFTKFFIGDLKEFFSKNQFKTATWEKVQSAMLGDPDVTGGEYGEVFRKSLDQGL